jgi:hypothetical protein
MSLLFLMLSHSIPFRPTLLHPLLFLFCLSSSRSTLIVLFTSPPTSSFLLLPPPNSLFHLHLLLFLFLSLLFLISFSFSRFLTSFLFLLFFSFVYFFFFSLCSFQVSSSIGSAKRVWIRSKHTILRHSLIGNYTLQCIECLKVIHLN